MPAYTQRAAFSAVSPSVLSSILAALYANAHLPEGQKVSAEDFVPGEAAPQGPPPELQAAAWKRFADKHAGKTE